MKKESSKSIWINIGLLFAGLVIGLFIIEMGLRIFAPKQYIVPCSDWVPEYGIIAYPSVKIVNAQPGKFRNIYTTNEFRMRGPVIDPHSPQPKVLIIGDSNIFGIGVNDDETIDAHFNKMTNGDTVMINMGNGGWSLPQEVRRYFELGEQYDPFAVIIDMTLNDIVDHIFSINWVAYSDSSGTIKFRDALVTGSSWIRTVIPPNTFFYRFIMTNQIANNLKMILYNYQMSVGKYSEGTTKTFKDSTGSNIQVEPDGVPASSFSSDQVIVMDELENQVRYAKLLRAFAEYLAEDQKRFIFTISCSRDNFRYEMLKTEIDKLEEEGLLELFYVYDDWFVPGVDYEFSKQGHILSSPACKAFASELRKILASPVLEGELPLETDSAVKN